MTVQQFCLRWNNHQPNFISAFTSLLSNETLVDVTLAAEGKHLQAHKVVLSACSTYFQSLFIANPSRHPIVILKDVKHSDLKILVHFMYYGEVNVSQDQLPQILEAARMLKIKGLTEMSEPASSNNGANTVNTTERPNLLTPGDSSWHSDAQTHRDPSPHHALSPSSRRKKNRKHSRSPSHERAPEVPVEQNISTTLRTEATNFAGAPPNNPFCSKARINDPQTNEYNTSKDDSFDENGPVEGNLIIDADEEPNDCNNIIRVSEQITDTQSVPSTPQQGPQWSGLDGTYQRYSTPPFHSNNVHNIPPFNVNNFHPQELPFGMQGMINPYEYPTTSQNQSQSAEAVRSSPGPSCSNTTPQDNQSSSSSAPKRRRTTNPQSEENFQQALEAVRVGGIGFCKAARMYGVNNRTLWLEYKKKGYPNNRPSIKSRIKQEHSSPPPDENPAPIPDQQLTLLCQPHPVGMMGFIDPRPVDFTSGIQNVNRPRYVDDPMNLHNSPLNLHGLNFNTLQ